MRTLYSPGGIFSHLIFMKDDIKYCNNFERLLRLKKSMYGINNLKIFADGFKNWRIDVTGFKKALCQMYIYYKYPPHGPNIVLLYYVDDCVF